jgi:hypothetical protein
MIGGYVCACGHDGEAHEHYRHGRDCALCPPGACGRFRYAGGFKNWLPRGLSALARVSIRRTLQYLKPLRAELAT